VTVFALWLAQPWLVNNQMPWVTVLAVNAALVGLGLWAMFARGTSSALLGGTLLVLLVVNQRFFDGEFSLWIKGLVFVASGLLLWGFHAYQTWRATRGAP